MSKTYREQVYELRRMGRNAPRTLPWEYYAVHMNHAIVEKFVNDDLPALKAAAELYNIQRGRLTNKLRESGPHNSIGLEELSPCEVKVFWQMKKAGHAGLTPYNKAVPDCVCKWCCAEGPTCSQYRWNRLMDRW